MSKQNKQNKLKKFKKGDYITTISERTEDGRTSILVEVKATKQMKVDRSEIAAWGLSLSHRKLAERLKKCLDDLKAFNGYTVGTDYSGNTYICQDCDVRGRYMNSCLIEKGY